MKQDYSWAKTPLLGIGGALMVLFIGGPLWAYIQSNPVGIDFSGTLHPFSLSPLFAIPALTACMVIIISRRQWTYRKLSQRLYLNTLLLLCNLLVIPLLFWNIGFLFSGWLFSGFSFLFLQFLSTPTGIISVLIGMNLNISITICMYILNRRIGIRLDYDSILTGCFITILFVLLIFGPFLVAIILENTPLASVALFATYGVYLGTLFPALWPHFALTLHTSNF